MEPDIDRLLLQGIPFKQLSTVDIDSLTVLFSDEEMKEAVWSCGGNKSLGPDGFNFE